MTAIAAFTLTSPSNQTSAPFFIGHAFKKGDVPTGQHLHVDSKSYAITPLRYWNDGSVKHAAIMGQVDLVASEAKQFNIVTNTSAADVGTVLTAADIQTAAPTAVATLGAFGSVSLASLLATPDRTYISTKEMVECHYHANVGADPSLYVIFHVRLFATGDIFVRVIVGNSYFNSAEEVQKDYIPSISINGSVVWDNGGATYLHSRFTRYDVVGWIGTDPQITPRHDTTYLNQTKLVPNYWRQNPDQAEIDYYLAHENYSPGDNLDYTEAMGQGGYQRQIGLLPLWDALYITTEANATMYSTVLAHARAINSYIIAVPDSTIINPPKISDYPDYSINGQNQGGGSGGRKAIAQDGITDLAWEGAHFPSAGYLAYILTADFYYFESCYFNSILPYWFETTLNGSGFDRLLKGQNRARGWAYRSISQTCAILPDNLTSEYGEIITWFKTLIGHRKTYYIDNAAASAWIGYEDLYSNRLWNEGSLAPNGETCAGTAPWEHHFTTASIGMASDIEPIDAAGMVNLNAFRDFLHNAPIWILGGDTVNDYNFGHASNYTVNIRIDSPGAAQFSAITKDKMIAANGGMIISDTESTDVTPFTNVPNNTLLGTSSEEPTGSKGYWGNLLPAIAYAVDHNKTGADTAWGRITGATNFSDMQNASYDDTPIWGIVPRSYSQPAAVFTPVDAITGVGRTIRIGDVYDDLTVIGECGHGVLTDEIPSSGTSGPSILFNDFTLPDDSNIEYSCEILTWPSAGNLFVYEDGRIEFTGAPDGTYTFQYQPKVYGQPYGDPQTVTLNVGANIVTATVTSVQAPQTADIVATVNTLKDCSVVAVQAPQTSTAFGVVGNSEFIADIVATQAPQTADITASTNVTAICSVVSAQSPQSSTALGIIGAAFVATVVATQAPQRADVRGGVLRATPLSRTLVIEAQDRVMVVE